MSSAYRWLFNERDEIRVLRGDVYIMNSRGPRTEPWGTPHNLNDPVERPSNGVVTTA